MKSKPLKQKRKIRTCPCGKVFRGAKPLCLRCRAREKYQSQTPLERRRSEEQRLRKRKWQFEKRWGIPWSVFLETLEMQAGLCQICCEPMVPGNGTHVDHDHITFEFRGLLCNKCNPGIGCFADSSLICVGAAEYLDGR